MKKYSYNIRDFQLRSVSVLEAVDKVCEEHGLRYFIVDGSLLGAVRHKGFIPWDDDIDIAMPREDYDTLIEHAEEWIPKPYSIITAEKNIQYPKYFAKFEDESTTLVENFALGYVGGIYLDVFPLDAVPDSEFLRRWHYFRFNLVRRLLYLAYRDPYKHGHGIDSVLLKALQSVLDKKNLHRMSHNILTEYAGKKECNFIMTHDQGLCAHRKEIFDSVKRYEFEGKSFIGPADADAFLSAYYGKNYMQLPPEEKRRSHYHDYCDMDNGYVGVDIAALKQKLEAKQEDK